MSRAFPRRMLAITASNYLYANSITYGLSNPAEERNRQDFFKFMDKLAVNCEDTCRPRILHRRRSAGGAQTRSQASAFEIGDRRQHRFIPQ